MWQTVNITSPDPGIAPVGLEPASRRLTSRRGIIRTIARTIATDRAPCRVGPTPNATATWG